MNVHYRLKLAAKLLIVALTIAVGLGGCSGGRQAYSRGNRAEITRDFETAMTEYKAALDKNPGNIEYRLKYEQARFNAAFQHFENGRRAVEKQDYETARKEFAQVLEIDPTHALAEQQLAKVNEILTNRSQNRPEPEILYEEMRRNTRTNPSVQSQLEPKIAGPIDVHMTQDSRVAFETLAELAGLNVIFDPDFRGARIPIELNRVDIYEALDILALQTRSFWKPVNKSTILVSPDNQTKRRDYEELVLKTIYLSNSVTSTEITEAITALRTLLNMRYLAQSTAMNAIIIRDTADRIAIAEKIIEDLDKAKPEVIVDATLLEVDRNTLRQLGIVPPQGTSLAYTAPGATPVTSPTGTTTTTTTTNNSVRLRNLGDINSANFAFTIPDSVAQFLASSSNTKLIQNPRVRATDGKLASIRIGSQVPIASGSFQPAFVGATGTPVVNFQFVDVGVNLDITPRVLLNREISMTVQVQVRAVAGDRNIGGVTQPVLTNRQVQHEIRLAEGETNILGGIITESEAVSLSGIPGLKDIPILRYLFSQEKKTRDSTEIIIMLTPHIVRMPAITEANMRGLYTGSETAPRLRTSPTTPAIPGQSPSAGTPAATPAGQTPAPTPVPPGTPATPPATAPATVPPGAPPPEAPPQAAVAPAPAQTEPQPTNASVAFSPSPVAVATTDPTLVNITVTGNNIFGADVTLSYDPMSFTIREVREGGFLSRDGQLVAIVQRLETQSGTVRLSLERPPGTGPVSGTGTLATLVLERGSRSGESVLHVNEFRIRDALQTVQVGKTAEVRVTVP
jgi:general secretion pathway protein D